jgi:drug/metabolite transporter (DMT)-like permease
LNKVLIGTGLVAMAAALFGMLATIARGAAAAGIDALPFVAWRAGIAVLTLLFAGAIVGRFRQQPMVPDFRVLKPDRRVALLLAGLCGALLNIAIFAAFLRVPIAVAMICFYTFPAIVTIFAVPLYGERLGVLRLSALGLSLIGLILVLLPSLVGAGGLTFDFIGVFLALFAAVCQAVFVLIAGRGFAPLTSVGVSVYVILTAVVISVPLAMLMGDTAGLVGPFQSPVAWPWILVGGILCAAVPTTAFIAGIGLIGPSRAAILMTIEPLVAVTLAALVLNEQPSPVQLVGGACVLVAAAVLQVAPRTAEIPAEAEGRTV